MIDVEATSHDTRAWFERYLDDERIAMKRRLERPGPILAKVKSGVRLKMFTIHLTLFQSRLVTEQVRRFLGWEAS